MKIVRSFLLIVNYKTIIVSALALAVSVFCHFMDLGAEFSLDIVGIAVVFPIVFSINSAYQRRETVLQQYAVLQSHGVSLFYIARDWVKDNNEIKNEIRESLGELVQEIKDFFLSEDTEAAHSLEKRVYGRYSKLSRQIQKMREYGLSGSEITRAHAYLTQMIAAFDGMKNIYYYRTPITLRAYSKAFIYSFPILYAPHFADYEFGLSYIMPVLYSFILISLDNIQDHLENPYDQVGEDDIKIEVEKYVAMIE